MDDLAVCFSEIRRDCIVGRLNYRKNFLREIATARIFRLGETNATPVALAQR
jgi:hypothetical protein